MYKLDQVLACTGALEVILYKGLQYLLGELQDDLTMGGEVE